MIPLEHDLPLPAMTDLSERSQTDLDLLEIGKICVIGDLQECKWHHVVLLDFGCLSLELYGES